MICAIATDLMGKEVPSDVRVDGDKVSLTVKKGAIAQLEICMK